MPTINELNAATQVSGSDLLPIFSQSNGDARKLSLANFANWLAGQMASSNNLVTQYAAPSSSGFTVQVQDASNSVWLVLTPTGTMASGQIKLPALASSVDKQELLVNTTNAVTALSFDGNGSTVTGAPSTLAAGGFFRLRYDAVTSTWYRVG